MLRQCKLGFILPRGEVGIGRICYQQGNPVSFNRRETKCKNNCMKACFNRNRADEFLCDDLVKVEGCVIMFRSPCKIQRIFDG